MLKFSDALVQRQKLDPTTIVGYTAGVFDLFHHGHLKYLEACSLHCSYLIVGVDIDALVRSKKGPRRPTQPDKVRLARVLATSLVKIAFLKDGSAEDILSSLRPSFYFVPSNRELGQQRISMIHMLGIELVRIPYTEGISTTDIIKRNHE